MKVASREDLQNLEKELDIIDESDWDFLDISLGNNLEYFNDVIDDNFQKRLLKDNIKTIIFIFIFCLLFIVSGVYLYNSTVGRYILTDGDASDLSVDSIYKLERISDAKSVTNSNELDEITNTLDSYFNILKNKSSYDILNSFCLSGSNFASTEDLYLSRMKYSLDLNDCNARALRCFGSYYSLEKINEVLFKNDTYYVYASVNYPDNTLLTEYFYEYSSNLQKFFITYEISESNILRWLLSNQDTYSFPTSEHEICIEMCKNSYDDFILIDDSFITSQCMSAYNYSVSQVIRLLGAGKAINQYE